MSDQARERAEADVIRTFVEAKSSASPYGQEQKQEVLDALAALLAENERLSNKILLAWHLTDDPEVLAALAGSKEEP